MNNEVKVLYHLLHKKLFSVSLFQIYVFWELCENVSLWFQIISFKIIILDYECIFLSKDIFIYSIYQVTKLDQTPTQGSVKVRFLIHLVFEHQFWIRVWPGSAFEVRFNCQCKSSAKFITNQVLIVYFISAFCSHSFISHLVSTNISVFLFIFLNWHCIKSFKHMQWHSVKVSKKKMLFHLNKNLQ